MTFPRLGHGFDSRIPLKTMERKPEQIDDGMEHFREEVRERGKIVVYRDTISHPEKGLMEVIERDVRGHTIYHVWYDRDENGRIVQERVIEKLPGQKPREGRYVYEFDDEGEYTIKRWEGGRKSELKN